MLSKSLKKSFATSAAAGGLLAASLVVAPATVSAPISNMACAGYESGVATTTTIRLKKYVARKGQVNRAVVRVRSEAGNPNGYVRISARPFRSKIVRLKKNDRATLKWRMKRKGTFEVQATFPTQRCFDGSSASAFYTVKKKRR